MLRARTAGTRTGGGNSRPYAGFRHHRLTGPNGPAINRLSGNGGAGRFGNPRPRLRRSSRHHGLRSAELAGKIGPRRHYRAGGWLARERAAAGRSHVRSAMRCGCWRGRHGGSGTAHFRPRALHYRGPLRLPGHRRAGSGDARIIGTLRKGLARTGQNLTRPRAERRTRDGSGNLRRRPARRNHGRGRSCRCCRSWRWRRSSRHRRRCARGFRPRRFRARHRRSTDRRMNRPSRQRRPNGRHSRSGPRLLCGSRHNGGRRWLRRCLLAPNRLAGGMGLLEHCCRRFRDSRGRLGGLVHRGDLRLRFGF